MLSDLRPWVLASQLLAEKGRCAEARPWLINAGKRGAMAMQDFNVLYNSVLWKHNEYHVSMLAFFHYDGFDLICSKQYVDSTATDESYETLAHSVSNIRSSIPF